MTIGRPPFRSCPPNGRASPKDDPYSAAMSLARARILVVHNSTYLVAASFTAMMALALLLAPMEDLLSLVIVAVAVATAVAWSTRLSTRHLSMPCPRCDELRPAISARIEGIDDPRRRLRAYRRSHFAHGVGTGIMMYSVFHFLTVAVWLDDPADIYGGLIVGEMIFIAGLWWLAYSLARHFQYHADLCPWCKHRRECRIAREIIIALEVTEKRGESE